MRISDILGMSLSNLWRRKTRTLLTVLGVLIGTTSIVVMLSLGIGLKSAVMEEVGSSGGLTQIVVYAENSYDESGSSNVTLDDAAIQTFLSMEHVESASGEIETYFPVQVGMYEAYAQVYGVEEEVLSEIELGEGICPGKASGTLELIAGNQTLCDFYDYKTGKQVYYEEGTLPNVDLLNCNMIAGIDCSDGLEENMTESMSQSAGQQEIFDSTFSETNESPEGAAGEGAATPLESGVSPDVSADMVEEEEEISYSSFTDTTKRVSIKVTGVTVGDLDTYEEYSYGYYTSIEQLSKFIRENYPEGVRIPGQPTDKNGKPYRDLKYSNVKVNVDDSENVEMVLQEIQEMGYLGSANKEWLEAIEQEFMIIEAVLGGIGGVAMLVAAISIANTMTMSTYERTKEIGIMKVLGCKLSNIRAMFLTEAAGIGFFGGVIGLVVSGILSKIVNSLVPLAMALDLGEGAKISVIPVWLMIVAIVFSTIIGMLAGFFPAQRATKLSPLNAIRNE